MEFKAATEYFEKQFKKIGISAPNFHVVLGSALGGAIESLKVPGWECVHEFPFREVPGLPTTKVAGHKGNFLVFKQSNGKRTAVFQGGRVHGYEGHPPRLSVLPVMASRCAGTKNFVLTNASGSLNKKFKPGTAMIIRDHVNMTGQNPLVGENPLGNDGRELGPRFPDMGQVYNKDFRKLLAKCLKEEKLKVNEGVYLGLLGPTYETPSEVKLFSKWGLDAVGMSTVWESISLKHSGAKIAGVALMTNYACGLVGEETLNHEDLLKTTEVAAQRILNSIFKFLERAMT